MLRKGAKANTGSQSSQEQVLGKKHYLSPASPSLEVTEQDKATPVLFRKEIKPIVGNRKHEDQS